MVDEEYLIRDVKEEDNLEELIAIIKGGFDGFANDHNFPNYGLSSPIAIENLIKNRRKEGIIAIRKVDGKLVGCNFSSTPEDPEVRAVGPIAVDRSVQGAGIGKRLMIALVDRLKQEGTSNIVLTQDAANYTSLCLYMKLGYQTTNHLGSFMGKCKSVNGNKGYRVRAMEQKDLDEVSNMWTKECGFSCLTRIRRTVQVGSTLPVAMRPFVIHDLENSLQGFTLGFFQMGATLTNSLEPFKYLLRHVSALCVEPSDLQPNFMVSLISYPDAVEWLLSEGFRIWKTHNHMVYKGGSFKFPSGGKILSISVAGN
eukprot:TRINITY_DN5332_c0_g2_i2.p1 TRINITY_DN5332_c0_g2~~TRINITY_DN5332_c0_g2_i2.p1  ORF type:complete len:312 (+),score=33.51 TRINITY_DN5332_c0_g2_i2:69-1004(+)